MHGYDKTFTWNYKVEFGTNIDYSEDMFYLVAKVAENVIYHKTVEKIMEAIKNNLQITQAELSEMTGLTRLGVEYNLSKLEEKGLIKRIEPDKGGSWKVRTERVMRR